MALLRSLIPSLFAGTLVGAALIVALRGEVLTLVFAFVALLLAVGLGMTGVDWRLLDCFPDGAARHAMGAVSAVMGIGGGTVGVPTMSMFGMSIRNAVATASACGIVISIPATVIAIAGGWDEPRMPPYSLGYVNLIGFALIASGSILAAPWGAQLAHAIPSLSLKRLFALVLMLTSARMFWRSLA